jgi:hypothetical protein
MPYIGTPAVDRFTSTKAASVFSGDGSTTAFTLDHAVGSDEDILVSVDGVVQEPSVAYAVSNGTTLTFTAAPSSNSGNNIFVYYLFRTVGTVSHPSNNALSATTGTFSDNVTLTGTTPTLTIGDAGAEDTKIVFDGNAQDFHIGLDDSADSLTVGLGSTLGTTSHMVFDANGHITKPLQPAFLVHKNNSAQSNIATDTDVTITFGAEHFDVNSDFNTSNSTFTAPVTGKYFLSTSIRLAQLDTDANYYVFSIVTSNRSYRVILDSNNTFSGDSLYHSFTVDTLADMDAGDTAKVEFNQGSGSAQTDASGDPQYTFFSGYLVA